MKTERRHDLETNVLAKNLEAWVEKLRPHASTILTAVAVVLAGYLLLSMWRTFSARRDREAWDQYQMAVLSGDVELDQLQRVAGSDEYSGSEMQEWAYVGWADRQLRLAAERYLIDRDDANKRLTNIAAIYDQLSTSAGNEDVRNRARLGLARVNEMQNRIEEARKHYAEVEGPLAAVAAERLKRLESKEAAEVTEWLATTDLPKPRTSSGPGTPGARPGFEAETPDVDAAPAGDAGKSLEEILSGLTGSGGSEPRYGEAAPPADDAGTDDDAADGAAPPADPAPSSEATPAGESDESAPSEEAAPSQPSEQPTTDQQAPAEEERNAQ